MHKRSYSSHQAQEYPAQQTRELVEMTNALSFWLDGEHYPSEGENFEFIVRSYLARRIPKKYEISTGFISILEQKNDSNEDLNLTRKVSRQFDIIIWDSVNFPSLFQAGDFVVVVPESVVAIIEVTKSLNTKKLKQDLEKFDSIYELYSGERQNFKPFTAILSFSCETKIRTILQSLEKYYLYDSQIPASERYRPSRSQEMSRHFSPLPGFIDSICTLDNALIYGRKYLIDNMSSDRTIIRYFSLMSEVDEKLSFGIFEKDLILYLSEVAARDLGKYEASVDIYREFGFKFNTKIKESLIIEDLDFSLPSLNIDDKKNPITRYFPIDTKNVSKFNLFDFSKDENLSIEIEMTGWIVECYSNQIIASGYYTNNFRDRKWRIYFLNSELHMTASHWITFSSNQFNTKFPSGEFKDLSLAEYPNILEEFNKQIWNDSSTN